MKRMFTLALFCLTNFITLGTALAQTHTVQAKIPFAFTVRNRVLPAGSYRFSSVGSNLLVIRGDRMPVIETSATFAGQDTVKGAEGLVFRKYGGQYFLREILSETATIQAAIPVSKLEQQARVEFARLNSNERTVVAGR